MDHTKRPVTPVRHESPEWADLRATLPAEDRAGALSRETADDWSLALKAKGIPHRLLRTREGWRILVPVAHIHLAADEIGEYVQEKPLAPAQPPPTSAPLSPAAQTAAAVAGLAVIFQVYITGPRPGFGLYPEMWHQLGMADSTLILRGEWWRALTALTLHADAAHFLGNVAIGGIFTAFLARALGSGTAWALFVASGFLGNLINAWFHGPGHLSLGASTAVFGVVGAMGAAAMTSHRKLDLLRTVAPVAAGMGILGMLGTGGERTDLGAHLFGFLAGLPLGALAGARVSRLGIPGAWESRLLGAAALAAMVTAWIFAFGG